LKTRLAFALAASCLLAIGIIPLAARATTDISHQSGGGSFADAVGFDPDTTLSVIADVSVGQQTFRSHQPPGNTVTISASTVSLQFGMQTPDGYGYGFGCWLMPPSDFVVGPDLSATLTFDSADPQVTECPGDPVGLAGGTTSGLVENLSGRIQLNVTWQPASPVVTTKTSSNISCHPYFDIGVGTTQSVDAFPSGSATGAFDTPQDPFGGSFQPQYGYVEVASGRTEISGFPGICGPLP